MTFFVCVVSHDHSKSKHSKLAKDHLEKVKLLLSKKDESLGEMAVNAPPVTSTSSTTNTRNRKRGSSVTSNRDGEDDDNAATSKRPGKRSRTGSSLASPQPHEASPTKSSTQQGSYTSTNKNPELAEREVRAMDQLREFIVDKCGGGEDLLDGFRVRVTKKKGHKLTHQSKYDINFYSSQNRRFRSMLEVGRFYNLVHENANRNSSRSRGGGGRSGRSSMGKSSAVGTKEQQAEKKRIRRDLDRLRKALSRATANLDDFGEEQKDDHHNDDDSKGENHKKQREGEMMSDVTTEPNSKSDNPSTISSSTVVTRRMCAGTRLCDVTALPSVPQHCIPDVLMAWDFMYTFQRVLSLQPIELPDFCAALAYQPPKTNGSDDLTMAPPVYLVEAHLSLLKLLLNDKLSDDWWWSTVETDEIVAPGVIEPSSSNLRLDDGGDDEDAEVGPNGEGHGDLVTPVIKIDMAQLLAQNEDTLVTTSWVASLKDIRKKRGKAVREAVKAAIKMARNKWVVAYLRKALSMFRSSSLGGPQGTRRAVEWLVRHVIQARPDIEDPSIPSEQIYNQRAKVVEKTMAKVDGLPNSIPTVIDEDVLTDQDEESDDDESDEDDDDDEDEEKENNEKKGTKENDMIKNRPASSVPPKPLPSFVDMLLPNEKPSDKADYINPFTWSQMTGATVHRILHRKKRIWNEVDDTLRANQDLPPLTIAQRRERERHFASRVLTECYGKDEGEDDKDFVDKAIEHLCIGSQYLDLDFAQRLSILRLMIEAAYDSTRIYDVVVGNYNQRTSAMKALEQEKKKAKKDAKEKALADEAAAREKLADEAREKFLDEKREEILRLNEDSKELSEEMAESLTDEDILDFDEDIKADFEALPTADSFTKAQVSSMVERMHEEAAFDTDALKVLTMEDLAKREQLLLEEMEGQLMGFGGEQALEDPSLDRETIRAIEGLRKDIEKAKSMAEKLPQAREKAIEHLKDAMQDGTIKVLRNGVTAAKKAKLTGPDDETGGTWALDLLRDAALQLENAKQNKKLIDAQKDLIAKRNKCFIRTEPFGRDRFGNRFWTFAHEEDGNIWAEAEYSLKDNGDDYEPPPGYADTVRDGSAIIVGAQDREDDFVDEDQVMNKEQCRTFCRREYHSTGYTPYLVHSLWGCHTSEESWRKVIKSLDGKSGNEKALKVSLQESLEKVDKQENEPEPHSLGEDEENTADKNDVLDSEFKTDGDEEHLVETKNAHGNAADVEIENLDSMISAIGQNVRVRVRVDGTKDSEMARYESGNVSGWKTRTEERAVPQEKDSDSDYEEMEHEPKMEKVEVPYWRVWTEYGNVVWLNGLELLESISRYSKKESSESYFEHDAAFLGYRNQVGRFCGKASEAPYSSSPFNFAKLMVKKEAELYPKLKIRSYDENWGGKSGERAAWTNKMKDYAFDTETVKQGLLTLETAFFHLTGEFEDYNLPNNETPDAVQLLEDPASRVEIELESEKTVQGLWNAPSSRAVFIEIVTRAATTGLLALALELLCRNTQKYLKKHGLLNTRTRETSFEELPSRRTRRKNAWQEANHDDWF